MQKNKKKVTFSRLGARTLRVGIAFVLVGSVGAFMFLGLGPFNPLHLVSLIFPTLGLGILMSSGWIKVDTVRQVIGVTEGIFGGFGSQSFSFNQIKFVEIVERVTHTDNRAYVQYQAVIILVDGRRIGAGDNLEFAQSRSRAEIIAKSLGVGCWDKVTNGGELRPFAELDMSLKQRLKNCLEIKGDGSNSRGRIRVVRGIYFIGARGFGKGDLFEFIVTLIICVSIAIFAGYSLMKLWPSLFWPVTVFIIAAPIVKHTLQVQKIELTNSQFIITSAVMGLSLRKHISIDNVEEIVDYDRALVLRSDTKEFAFARALNKSERMWLRARICQDLRNK